MTSSNYIKPKQDVLAESTHSWVLREAELHGAFESFTQESLEVILRGTINNLKKGSKVLDIGCGTGFFSFGIAKSGYKVYGVDVSEYLIGCTKANLQEGKASPSFLVGNGEALPFKSETFDACFCGVVLHHFPDITEISKEMWRVLKKGGVIFGVEPNNDNWHVFLIMSPNSPFRYDKNTPNERAISSSELTSVYREGLGMELNVDYQFLRVPHEGEIDFWDLPIIYKLFGFIVKKIKGLYRRLAAILIFNIIHAMQKIQGPKRSANYILFSARKIA